MPRRSPALLTTLAMAFAVSCQPSGEAPADTSSDAPLDINARAAALELLVEAVPAR